MNFGFSMNLTPRLANSKQWTELPPDLAASVKKVFEDQFVHEASQGEFFVEGRIYSEEFVIRLGYLQRGRLAQINFEASMDLFKSSGETVNAQSTPEESKTMARFYTSVDALGSLMEEYFDLAEGEDVDVPLRWKAYDFEGEIVFLQRSTVNTRLEDEADRILGIAEKRLVHEPSATEDALGKAEVNSELAFEIQKRIRSGEYPDPSET